VQLECSGCRIHRYVAALYKQPEKLTSKNKVAREKVLIKHGKENSKTEAYKFLESTRTAAKNFL
jgi:phosphatidylethanolamine-binding protein (PEBP) family uncharacterized protein